MSRGWLSQVCCDRSPRWASMNVTKSEIIRLVLAMLISFFTFVSLIPTRNFNYLYMKAPPNGDFKPKQPPEVSSEADAFNRLFASQQVQDYQYDYLRKCSNLPSTPYLAGLLSYLPLYGCGSTFLSALSVHLFASAVYPPRRFQIISFNWHYEPLSSFFHDFGKDVCPIFRTITEATEGERLLKTETEIDFTVPEIGFSFTGRKAIDTYYPLIKSVFPMLHAKTIMRIGNEESYALTVRVASQMRHAFNRIQSPGEVFRLQSALLRAIWQPLPVTMYVIEKMWSSILHKHGGYFGVHIRRGDKMVETKPIPFEEYARKMREVCLKKQQPKNCPTAVFIASDKRNANRVLQDTLGPRVTVYNLRDAIKLAGLEPTDYLPSEQLVEWSSTEHFWTPDERLRNTRQLILELTMLAVSDDVVCTYSSNICRITAMLRGNSTHGISSMDLPDWVPE